RRPRPRPAGAGSRAAGAGRRRPRHDRRERARASRHRSPAVDPSRRARLTRALRAPHRRARSRAGRVLPRRPPLGVGGLLRRRRGIRATGSLREVLNEIALVDHHAHGVLRAPPASLDEFRGLFSESPDPRQWPHVATGLTYGRAIAAIAAHLGCDANERAVYERRLASDPAEYAASFLRATNTEILLVDDGYPPTEVGTS